MQTNNSIFTHKNSSNTEFSKSNQSSQFLLNEVASDVKLMLSQIQELKPRVNRHSKISTAMLISEIGKARRSNLPPEIVAIGESAWTILLELFLCHETGRLTVVSDVPHFAQIPATTSLRYIGALVDYGLVERSKCQNDGRRIYLHLTNSGYDVVASILAITNDILDN